MSGYMKEKMDGREVKAYYHLPGLFEFYEFYKKFLPLYFEHREYFYDWCDIGSIYGSPGDCLWGGGRTGFGDDNPKQVKELLKQYGISARFTFSNSLLNQNHLSDPKCNDLCSLFHTDRYGENGIIVYSDLLAEYIIKNYPNYYLVSSTTKVITDFETLREELKRDEFAYVVPDFRLNHQMDKLNTLTIDEKKKVEFLCNECCSFGCTTRKACYENVSRQNLGEDVPDFVCSAQDSQYGYRFSAAMKNPGFIGIEEIQNTYVPMGFSNFKIEGRGLGNALLLEFILYYMTKPEYQINVKEEMYLDSMLDLF